MPSRLPFVSGIVAAYNYGSYLAEALDSALAQDYPDDRLEVIVIDDGSTDDTPEIAQRYARESGGIVRYIRQENAGLAAATNRGLAEARGDLLTLLDADDVWVRSRTRLLVDALARNPKAGLVYGDMEVIDGEGRTIHPSWMAEVQQPAWRGRVLPCLLRTNFVIAPSIMIRAELRERFFPIPEIFPVQDWYMAARIAEVADVDYVPAKVARYRRHGLNMNNGKFDAAEVARIFIRDIPIRRGILADVRAPDLTVEDCVEAYRYFMHTLGFAARERSVPVESLIEISPADADRSERERIAGRSRLAVGDFAGAASHFLGALAANPFDVGAQHGLDDAGRRLIVPLPRRVSPPAEAASIPGCGIRPGYRHRESPEYRVDLIEEREHTVAQPDVYMRAADVALRLGATRIIDLGSGSAGKLLPLMARFEVIGIDYGPNLELARRQFSDGVWREHDFDSDAPLPVTPDELTRSVLVCSGVLEHLVYPEILLGRLRDALPVVEAVIISTPDRDLASGPEHAGPPSDLSRVREWNIQEFSTLLEVFGFEHGALALTRSDSVRGLHQTILAVLHPDALRAQTMESMLAAA